MQIKDSKFMKVWKKEEKNGFTKLDLGDSKKKKDGTYDNFTWYGCTLLGKAKDVTVNEGDLVTIVSGVISKNKYNDKWYDEVVIFELEVTKEGKKPDVAPSAPSDGFVAIDNLDDDDLPF